ncbi:MAG: demethoxyubiquinone hydroxylase family protein [Proteobacteria bacterium]|nr:demethoxyubiquinone hydroxylase family protein [Pseudomonadota bacterium]
MPDKKKIAEIIRVNHAGEFGAKVIYDGQIAALKLKQDQESINLVKHMKEQEDVHFDYFNHEISNQQIRPTIMQPVWKVGGFALGFLTAIVDKKAAMCCTTAVEEVIDEHYQQQLNLLKQEENSSAKEKELIEKIEKFRAEELEHRDIGYEHKALELSYFGPLSTFVKCATKFAIAVSKKI